MHTFTFNVTVNIEEISRNIGVPVDVLLEWIEGNREHFENLYSANFEQDIEWLDEMFTETEE